MDDRDFVLILSYTRARHVTINSGDEDNKAAANAAQLADGGVAVMDNQLMFPTRVGGCIFLART